MGANLARSRARNGYATAVFNRTQARTERLISEHGGEADFGHVEHPLELMGTCSTCAGGEKRR